MKTSGTREKPRDHDESDAARISFERLVHQYSRELKVHCYRMMGSIDEAEDLLQETLVRAWRGLGSFEGRSSLRTWLYRIATNTCLNALGSRANPHRVLADLTAPPSTAMPKGEPDSDAAWLEPYPDVELEGIPDEVAGPAARYEMSESVRLAFIAAIQLLPARQRAVLLLCDVLGWSAAEVSDLLGGSVAAVNSALQRARASLATHYPNEDRPDGQPMDTAQRALLDRYVRAWERSDLDAFVQLLREDAIYRMPPWHQWYQGRDAIRSFFQTAWKSYGSFSLVPISANRQPAFGVYVNVPSAPAWRPHSIQVLELQDDSIASLTKFVAPLGPRLFPSFRLSKDLEGA
jgi:RNA polymerase sigma-70 factor (ECF subfamily)